MLNLPFNQSEGTGTGAPAGTPIKISGLKAHHRLLAVVKHDASHGVVEGLDPNGFEVRDGAVASQGIDTEGFSVAVLYLRER